ncbi:hypothetical protein [Hyphomicrobium sulfonivorans]|uniref:hypothetical protein n=1 Tax=Hyphomicrobium sulfonivorans TaxID=121290 RepID=UPI0015700AEE|nr:hypothetical protein [Hyphomicrobium sulfonivorans]MBI1649266.1 hypothetical protein [Hyphomicrobium sulfonivorans]NSL70203.1 hypothetical protein [Hyphomicrobium sulfonivorans]
MWAHDGGTIVTTGPVTATTSGAYAYGAYAASGGSITIDQAGSTISASHDDGSAVVATGTGSRIELRNGIGITAVNGAPFSSGYGFPATNSAYISADGCSVTNTRSDGARAAGNSIIELSNGAITIENGSGNIGLGGDGQINANAVVVNVSGPGAYGVSADGIVNLTNGTQIITTGVGFGVTTFGGQINVDASTIRTAAGTGVYSQFSGQVTLANESQVITTGANTYGIDTYDRNTIEILSGSSVTTTGANSAIARLGERTTIAVVDSALQASGAGSAGIVTDGSILTEFSMTNSTLQTASGPALSVTPGALNATVNNSTITSGTELLNVGPTGVLNIDATNSTVTGVATTASGGTAELNLVGSSVWNITGNSSLTHLATQIGSVAQFTPPPSAAGPYKTLTVTNYFGLRGTVGINTHLGSDGSPSDRMIIDGGAGIGSAFYPSTTSAAPVHLPQMTASS